MKGAEMCNPEYCNSLNDPLRWQAQNVLRSGYPEAPDVDMLDLERPSVASRKKTKHAGRLNNRRVRFSLA